MKTLMTIKAPRGECNIYSFVFETIEAYLRRRYGYANKSKLDKFLAKPTEKQIATFYRIRYEDLTHKALCVRAFMKGVGRNNGQVSDILDKPIRPCAVSVAQPIGGSEPHTVSLSGFVADATRTRIRRRVMTIELVIEDNKLIWKSTDTAWQRKVTPEEYNAFQFGIKKGHELVALEIKKKIMELPIKCYPEHPLSYPRK